MTLIVCPRCQGRKEIGWWRWKRTCPGCRGTGSPFVHIGRRGTDAPRPRPEPPPRPKQLVTLEITRAEAEILAIALFGKIQLCEKNECDIRNWGDVDLWDLYCRIGQFAQTLSVPKPQPPPNRETREGDTHAH